MTKQTKPGAGKVNRRAFIQSTASGVATATAFAGAPAILSQPNPNAAVGLAHVGVGVRGYELMEEAKRFPAVRYRSVCDLYDGFLQRGVDRAAGGPELRATKRYEEAIDRDDVDAVIIAVPDHWHAQIALDAANAGKHIYLEKPFTNTLDQARILVETVRQAGVSFQLGHNLRSTPAVWKARELVGAGKLGKLVHIRAQHYRNSLEPYLRWYGFYSNYQMPDDADPEHIDWERFQQNVRKHSFHPLRFFHWRCYWDYTNGVAGDLQSHALDEINAIVGMGIPETCAATGGLYFWRDGRETPDTWNAVFDYPGRGLSINYAHVAMSDHYGTGVQIMGKDAAIDLSSNEVKLFAESSSPRYREEATEIRRESGSFDFRSTAVESYRPEASFEEASHIGDWLRGIQEGKPTRSNIDTAWEEIVTVLMAYESFRRGCKVRWDHDRQEIV